MEKALVEYKFSKTGRDVEKIEDMVDKLKNSKENIDEKNFFDLENATIDTKREFSIHLERVFNSQTPYNRKNETKNFGITN